MSDWYRYSDTNQTFITPVADGLYLAKTNVLILAYRPPKQTSA